MNRKFTPLVLVGALVLGGAMFAVGRNSVPVAPVEHVEHAEESHEEHAEESHEEHGEGEAIVFAPEALKTLDLEVAPVVLREQIVGLPFNGTIEASPDHVARVSSVVSGHVTKIEAAIGQKVGRGQILALIESRGVGEAQSAYSQAVARLKNARSQWEITQKQAKAGVFSRGPLESARRAHIEAQAEVKTSETAVRSARQALENVTRLAKTGSFARPALEKARGQVAVVNEQLQAAQAALENAQSARQAAQNQLARRREIAQNGGYSSRPVEEARRVLVAAQSSRATAQSEVSTTRANLQRAKSLAAEGLVSTRDLESAQNAFETAENRLRSAFADETAASQELERQQKLASSDVAQTAEISEANALLAAAQSDEKTRRAQVVAARENLRLAQSALKRESAVFEGNLANRREFAAVRADVERAQNALEKARQNAKIANVALERETKIYRQNLNNSAQIASAQSVLTSAQSDWNAAKTALDLLKSAPGGNAIVPIRAPIAGVVQSREITLGETVAPDKNLMTIVNLDIVHVDMELPERDVARVQIGAPVSIRVDAVPNRTFSGEIELIHSELNPKTRTLEAHAEIQNSGSLRPGMFARGTIGTGTSQSVLSVPADAIQDLEGEKVVFVAREKAGEFEARKVELGATNGGKTVVKSGLKSGERVVIRGAFMVKAQAMKAELGHDH